MLKAISSLQNPLIKQIALLQEKSRERRKTGLFIIEGQREISLALKGNYRIKTLLFCSEIISEQELVELKEDAGNETEFIEIAPEIYEKLAYRSSTEGILAIAFIKECCSLSESFVILPIISSLCAHCTAIAIVSRHIISVAGIFWSLAIACKSGTSSALVC